MLRMSDLVRGAAAPPEPATTAVPAPVAPRPRDGAAAMRPGTPASIMHALHVSIAGVRELVVAGIAPSWTELEIVFGRVVSSLEDSAQLFWLVNAPTVPPAVDDLVAHQSRVAVLAARLGLNAGYDRARAVTLATAAAFIDIAPAPLAGQDAKIVELVDAYARLTLPASRTPGLRPHEAVRELMRSKNESFSPALIKALLSEISVFPPGTLVRLNTGEVGQVTTVNRNHPLRPKVEVVADAKGNPPPGTKTIDLSETPFLYITGPVSEGAK